MGDRSDKAFEKRLEALADDRPSIVQDGDCVHCRGVRNVPCCLFCRRGLVPEILRLRAENAALLVRASKVPGLSAELDRAPWERDIARGDDRARGRALDEIEQARQVALRGRDEGRRETLWLVAAGAMCSAWQFQHDWHADARAALGVVALAAIESLSKMGDNAARAILDEFAEAIR